MNKQPSSVTTAAAAVHDDSSLTSTSCSSIGNLSIDVSSSLTAANNPTPTKRQRTCCWSYYLKFFLIGLVMTALAVLLYLYSTHCLNFLKNDDSKEAAVQHQPEKKTKSQMYWHKAVERRSLSLKSKCQETGASDSKGTLVPVLEDLDELLSLVVESGDKTTYTTVKDSSMAISSPRKLEQPHLLLPRSATIRMKETNLHNNNNGQDKSEYEIMSHDGRGTFYKIRSSFDKDHVFHAAIEEIDDNQQQQVVPRSSSCPVEFQFGRNNIGFEGMTLVRDVHNELVMLVVCQGNHCSGDAQRRRERGNGVVLVMKKEQVSSEDDDSSSSSSCEWFAVRALDLPSSASFEGYSNVAIRPQTGRVAVTGMRDDNQVWVGTLLGQDANGQWDVESMEFDSTNDDDKSAIYDFPRDDNCQHIYCNVRGLDWIDDDTIIAVSDSAGDGGMNNNNENHDPTIRAFHIPESPAL